jgi:hypothetical protein
MLGKHICLTCYTSHECASGRAYGRSRGRPAPYRWKEPTIYSHFRSEQGDLVVGLLNLLGRNRFALVVLAASLTAGARSRAREAYADSSAVRWLARNARAVRHFLSSLSLLRRCAGHAGYRALERACSSLRRASAPRLVLPFGASMVHHEAARPPAWVNRFMAVSLRL